MSDWTNQLYFGDNLPVLRERIAAESVDLIYLDPPFNSNASYNVLFKEGSGEESAAQITAFDDTWHWTIESERAYREVVTQGPDKLSRLLQALREFLGQNDMMAYLTMMAQRLAELHRVLKPTGSIYLHCDPTASHYLKLLMDATFGAERFRNEIIWRRTGAHGNARRFGPIHDNLLFYTKGPNYIWRQPKGRYMKGHVNDYFVKDEQGWRTNYYGNVLTGSGITKQGESGKPWRGFDPSAKGRHWAIPGRLLAEVDEDLTHRTQHEKLDRLYELGYIKIEPGAAWPIYQHYITADDGPALSDIWAYQPYTEQMVFGTADGIDAEVRWLAPRDQERLGYPTQKPEALLERIIKASSNEGDVVLDPFCGCGTAVAVAERLKRRWIGIDLTHLAISLMKHRLHDTFGDELSPYRVIGLPEDVASARALATESEHDGRYQFEYWALGLVDARPSTGKKGADSGVDGYINFFDDNSGKARRIIVQVKSGHVNRSMIATLKGDMEREGAALGFFITLEPPTEPMLQEAIAAGFYEPGGLSGNQYPKVQILTIEQLLSGDQPEYPRFAASGTFKRAPRHVREQGTQGGMFGD